jgi:hypothetical protein
MSGTFLGGTQCLSTNTTQTNINGNCITTGYNNSNVFVPNLLTTIGTSGTLILTSTSPQIQ